MSVHSLVEAATSVRSPHWKRSPPPPHWSRLPSTHSYFPTCRKPESHQAPPLLAVSKAPRLRKQPEILIVFVCVFSISFPPFLIPSHLNQLVFIVNAAFPQITGWIIQLKCFAHHSTEIWKFC